MLDTSLFFKNMFCAHLFPVYTLLFIFWMISFGRDFKLLVKINSSIIYLFYDCFRWSMSRDYIPTPSQEDIHLCYFVKIFSFAFSFHIRNASLIDLCVQSEVCFGVRENSIVPAPLIEKPLSTVWLWCLGWKSVVCSSADPSPGSRFCSLPVCQYWGQYCSILPTVSHGESWH